MCSLQSSPHPPAVMAATPGMILLHSALLFLLSGGGRCHSPIPLVIAPETWRLGVLESVHIRTFQQSLLVKVSLVSFPDKNTTFSSALLPLTLYNDFWGAVELSVTAGGSPGEFVYLVVESEKFREEMKIPVSSVARTPASDPGNTSLRRRRRQSVPSVLSESQIEAMTAGFYKPKMKQCCREGSDYYSRHQVCLSEDSKELKQRSWPCNMIHEQCCKETERHMLKDMPFGSGGKIAHMWTLQCKGEMEEEKIVVKATWCNGRRKVTRTFTIKTDPPKDVSIKPPRQRFRNTWRPGVGSLCSVYEIRSLSVKVSLVSYPDKKTTFSSALRQLASKTERVELSMAAGGSPGESVYLVVESEEFRKVKRIRVGGTARTPASDPGNVCSKSDSKGGFWLPLDLTLRHDCIEDCYTYRG